MSTVTVPQVNPNDEVTALSVNQGPNAIAAVVNGNLDDANISTVSGTKITAGTAPSTIFTDSANVEKFRQEGNVAFVQSGLIWSALTGLNGAMTSGVLYATNGSRISVAAIATRAFTASRDTYVSVSATGVVDGFQEVTNNATPPTLAAGYQPLSKVVTNGSAITSVSDMRQLTPGANVYRQDDAVNTFLTIPNVQTGQMIKAYAAVGTITVPVVFPKPFLKIPIVIPGFAGDSATASGYGTGAINIANGVVARANSITTTGFTLSISKADSTNFASSGFGWVTWIAVA